MANSCPIYKSEGEVWLHLDPYGSSYTPNFLLFAALSPQPSFTGIRVVPLEIALLALFLNIYTCATSYIVKQMLSCDQKMHFETTLISVLYVLKIKMCMYSQKSHANYIICYIIAFSKQFFREQGSSDFPKCFF